MKRVTLLLAFVLLAGPAAANRLSIPDPDETIAALKQAEADALEAAQWEVFSKNLVRALKMDNDGVNIAAMQLVIRYADHLDVDAAVFDVVRLYRDHPKDEVRRMAVVTLGKMQHRWAMGFLELSEDYEKSVVVRRTINDVVAEYRITRGRK